MIFEPKINKSGRIPCIFTYIFLPFFCVLKSHLILFLRFLRLFCVRLKRLKYFCVLKRTKIFKTHQPCIKDRVLVNKRAAGWYHLGYCRNWSEPRSITRNFFMPPKNHVPPPRKMANTVFLPTVVKIMFNKTAFWTFSYYFSVK